MKQRLSSFFSKERIATKEGCEELWTLRANDDEESIRLLLFP